VSDLLFGRASPSGRLPNTWYREAFIAAAPMEEFGMRPDAAKGYPGRTYRFVEDPKYVLYPFGHGLSYATFRCGVLRARPCC
jgi:beta-D-xylosidase 4